MSKILLIIASVMVMAGCGSDVSHTIGGTVDTNVNINDNQCQVAMDSNGTFYVFNRSSILSENIGFAMDPTAVYGDIPVPLTLADTYRVVPYTQIELDFINTNL